MQRCVFFVEKRVHGVGVPGTCARAPDFLCLAARMPLVEIAEPDTLPCRAATARGDFDSTPADRQV